MLLATAHCPLLTQKFMAPNSMYSVTKLGLKKKKGNVYVLKFNYEFLFKGRFKSRKMKGGLKFKIVH